MSNLQLLTIDKIKKDDWNSKIESASLHPAFRYEWGAILENTFGHKSYSLGVKGSNGELTAALPLTHMKSLLFGRSLISMPYLNAGGVFSESMEGEALLLNSAKELAKSLNVDYLEIRSREKQFAAVEEFHERQTKVAMLLDLKKTPDEVFSDFPAKLRSQIRRPTKEGMTAETTPGNEVTKKQIDAHYKIFAENMRDLGTPVYPKKLFVETLKQFGKDSALTLVYFKKQAVASGIVVKNSLYSEIPWASSLKSHNRYSPNMLLYWEVIQHAVKLGCEIFDFGRTTAGSGPHRFKKQWGTREVQLPWNYYVRRGKLPDVNPKNSSFGLLSTCWQKLPLPIANLIGPTITKSIP